MEKNRKGWSGKLEVNWLKPNRFSITIDFTRLTSYYIITIIIIIIIIIINLKKNNFKPL